MPPGEQLAPFSTCARHYNGKFINKRNENIYCYYWKPLTTPRALLLISHGYTEHCMMYDSLATEMTRRGFFVFAHDHAGHGHSEGERGFVSDMYDLVDDSVQHLQMVREEFPDIPLFICSHSMGCSVSMLISFKSEVDVHGVVLIAPAFAPNPETATFFRITVAKLLSKFFPYFPVAPTDFSLSCQNENKVHEMNRDPLRYKGYWKVRPVVCLLQSGEEILKKCSEVKVPFLVLHGDSDKICHMRGATEFYEYATSEDKTLKIYEGGYHSLLNEPSDIADDVFDQTIQWLNARVQ